MKRLSAIPPDLVEAARVLVRAARQEAPEVVIEFNAATAARARADCLQALHRIVAEHAEEDRQEALVDYWVAYARFTGSTDRWKRAGKRLDEAAIRFAQRSGRRAADTWKHHR